MDGWLASAVGRIEHSVHVVQPNANAPPLGFTSQHTGWPQHHGRRYDVYVVCLGGVYLHACCTARKQLETPLASRHLCVASCSSSSDNLTRLLHPAWLHLASSSPSLRCAWCSDELKCAWTCASSAATSENELLPHTGHGSQAIAAAGHRQTSLNAEATPFCRCGQANKLFTSQQHSCSRFAWLACCVMPLLILCGWVCPP